MKRIGHIPVAIDSFFWMELLFLGIIYLEIFLDQKVWIFFFLESFNLWRLLLISALCHQTKTPISFWCRWKLNLRSLIQPSETLPVELTRTHKKKKKIWMWRLTHKTKKKSYVYEASLPFHCNLMNLYTGRTFKIDP